MQSLVFYQHIFTPKGRRLHTSGFERNVRRTVNTTVVEIKYLLVVLSDRIHCQFIDH